MQASRATSLASLAVWGRISKAQSTARSVEVLEQWPGDAERATESVSRFGFEAFRTSYEDRDQDGNLWIAFKRKVDDLLVKGFERFKGIFENERVERSRPR